MAVQFRAGDAVQTPFGKGTVREVRKNRRVVVDVRDRALIFAEAEISLLDEHQRRSRSRAPSPEARSVSSSTLPQARDAPTEIDLHGLTVDQALAAAERALNDALLADLPELRFIHGRSGGRIRDALHRWLRGIRSVRWFRLDLGNEGVTIVGL